MVKYNKQYDILYDASMNVYNQLIILNNMMTTNRISINRDDVKEPLVDLQTYTEQILLRIENIGKKITKIGDKIYSHFAKDCKGRQWSTKIYRFASFSIPEFIKYTMDKQTSIDELMGKINKSLNQISEQCDNTSNVTDDRPCVKSFVIALQQLKTYMENIVQDNSIFVNVLDEGLLFLDKIISCVPIAIVTLD